MENQKRQKTKHDCLMCTNFVLFLIQSSYDLLIRLENVCLTKRKENNKTIKAERCIKIHI